MKAVKSLMGSLQEEFCFFRAVQVPEGRGDAVLSLSPFRKGIDLEMPSAFAWDSADSGMLMTKRVRMGAMANGVRKELSYAAWLEWATPLSGSGIRVERRENCTVYSVN